ncbi:helix-turn-helix domain-containing protein [Phreatobacter oligotrophus]|uniref:Xre family transcriptional regulator n=1 Tax=Phreatobacter oligotrophus TaxID=1122261 RepID=A0A2T4YY42_9HYPH|nr:helix-turn-helix transcriptional regulator [Phreatobacter oligotrophus]PTM51467.1 Xre family transcriptional regulator [Phreatobacter oligotrophus]
MRKSRTSEHYVRFQERLLATRKANGLTQAEVALRLGKPQSFVAKVENGERRLDVIELVAYVSAIGAEPVAFITAMAEEVAGGKA